VAACEVHGAGDLRVSRTDLPALAATDVRLRIHYGGICGSDLHYAVNGRNGDYAVREPLVLGHEVSGVVVATGDAVRGVRLGERVTVHPATPCPPPGEAAPTTLHLASDGRYLGSAARLPHTQGAFAELVDVRADQLRVLPDELPLRRAALAEPLAVGLHAVGLLGDVTGQSVLVSGVGPIGQLAVLALRHRGAGRIVATDLSSSALETARAVGADETILLDGLGGLPARSVDAAIEASGAPAALRGVIGAVADGGTIVQLGILPPVELPMRFGELQTRELAIRGSWRFDIELDEAVAVLNAHPEADAVIAREFPLAQAPEAFAFASDPAASGKVLLRIGDPGDSADTD